MPRRSRTKAGPQVILTFMTGPQARVTTVHRPASLRRSLRPEPSRFLVALAVGRHLHPGVGCVRQIDRSVFGFQHANVPTRCIHAHNFAGRAMRSFLTRIAFAIGPATETEVMTVG